MTTRVRTILSNMNAASKKRLIKLLPALDIPADALVPVLYPSALLRQLPKENAYLLLGIITESLLRFSIDQITMDTLIQETCRVHPITDALIKKIRISKTTEPFLQHLRETRSKFDAIVGTRDVVYDSVVSYQSVEGHPDAQTSTQLFEVKMTGRVEKEWKSFLLQAYSYAALEPSATELYLILPLQEQIIDLSLRGWPLEKRQRWRDLMQAQTVQQVDRSANQWAGQLIQQRFGIGMHVGKKPSLVDTVRDISNHLPFQIFLGSPTSARLSISDAEIAAAASIIGSKRIYVHSPYIINLCKDGQRDELLVKNIQYAVSIGCKGVVVHVGKTTTQSVDEAMDKMCLAIADALTFATPECPVLLETPAGQGTETLTDRDHFLGFVMSFGDPRLAICVDTCHVFTCGHDPLSYLKAAYETGLLRLIHFNDSETTCGACVDRHAYIGTGHIGPERMAALGEFGAASGVDMVVE